MKKIKIMLFGLILVLLNSLNATAVDYEVYGSGLADVNGLYTDTGQSINGQPVYANGVYRLGHRACGYASPMDSWVIVDGNGGASNCCIDGCKESCNTIYRNDNFNHYNYPPPSGWDLTCYTRPSSPRPGAPPPNITKHSIPPSPNPMTWSSEPHETSTSSISMTCTAASDPSTPITYYFSFSNPTGGSGGTNSGWISNKSYTDTGLSVNHQYGYKVKSRDGNNNETAFSSVSNDYTDIQTPSGITFGTVTTNSIQARSTNTPSGLTRGSSGLIVYNVTRGTNSGWKTNNNYWTSGSLTPNTQYGFRAKARNGDSNETGYSSTYYKYTLANQPSVPSFSAINLASIQANWSSNGNPTGTTYYCENLTKGTNSGWTSNAYWVSAGLGCGSSYSFRVKARNTDGLETSWTSLGSQNTLDCPVVDSDGDGLPNTLEDVTCTDPFDDDSDNDGLLDGNEDANHNGVVDPGETDPCNEDSDSDGQADGNDPFPNDSNEWSDADGDGTGDNEDLDDDNDGIDDVIESSGPNSGDANDDGILDSLQNNVASVEDFNAHGYVVLETPPGTVLSNCQTADNPSPDDAPADVYFEYGFFGFTISGIAVGGSTTLTMILPDGITVDTYYRYGKTPDNQVDHWYEFLYDGETGAEINNNVITFHFVDALRGDDILIQDSMVVDLGGPGFPDIVDDDGGDGGDGDGGDGDGGDGDGGDGDGGDGGGGGGGGGCFVLTATQ